MAKTANANTSTEVEIELTAKTQGLIDAIKTPFKSYSAAFAALEEKRADLAPKFMKAARAWMAEMNAGFTDFVRYLSPELTDADTKTIRASRAWMAADYLKRLDDKNRRAKDAKARGESMPDLADRPASPATALPRILASFVRIIPDDVQVRVWDAIKAELNWSDQQVSKLQDQIKQVTPAVIIGGIKAGQRVRVSQPEHVEAPSFRQAA